MANTKPGGAPMSILLEADTARHISPEGQAYDIPIVDLLNLARDHLLETGTGMLPPGVRSSIRRGQHTIWLGEFLPMLRPVRWITDDSPVPFGAGTQYTTRTIALPYVVVLGVFEGSTLSRVNECFFRTAPLTDDSDELLYPCLLNVSRFRPNEGQPLAWICTQHLDARPIRREQNPAKRMTIGWQLLCQTLFEASFNRSSEFHEGASWFSESREVDPRIATIESWEAASSAEPLFMLDVPFLKTGLTLAQVVNRIFENLSNPRRAPTTADVTRLIINHSTARKPR